MLRTRQMTTLSQHLAKLTETLTLPEDITWSVDIEPVNLAEAAGDPGRTPTSPHLRLPNDFAHKGFPLQAGRGPLCCLPC
jgi:hypothetical protein